MGAGRRRGWFAAAVLLAGAVAVGQAGADTEPRLWVEAQAGDSYWSIARRLAPACSQAQVNELAQVLQARNGNVGLFVAHGAGTLVDYLEGDVPVCGPVSTTTTSTSTSTTRPPATTSTTRPPATTTLPGTTVPPITTTTKPPVGGVQPIPSNFDVNRYIVTTGDGIPASSASEPNGSFRFVCEYSHLAYDDPIVYPGQPGVSHLHMFYGNTLANASSSYQSLRTTGDSTCQGGPINRSAYWAPAVIAPDGKVVVPDDIIVYYKAPITTQADIRTVQELPAGLKIIAGANMVGPADQQRHFSWYCYYNQVKQSTIPHCGPDDPQVGVFLEFPACWDGKNLDSPDHRSHMAYEFYDGSGPKPKCPATHPVQIPRFSLGLWYHNNGQTEQWRLSSDVMPGMTHPNGSTFHADWFGAWDPGILTFWTKTCVVAMLNCKSGELGNGTSLSSPRNYTGPRFIDPPR